MSEPKRIALYGGSFDPPHMGHRKLVQNLLRNFPDLQKICIIPNRISPFKRQKYFLPNESFILCKLNFEDLDPLKIEVLDIEIHKESISYTYESILEVKSKYIGYELDLIIGDDQVLDLIKWKNIEIILKEVSRFIVYRRKYAPFRPIPLPNQLLSQKFLIQENELWKESSSDWRANPSSKNLYPKVLDEILNIIRNKYPNEIFEKWRKVIQKELTETRFNHSIRVSNLAEELSISYGYLFPQKAKIAGLVHDITKQKTIDFHLEKFNRYGFDGYKSIPKEAYHAFSGKFYLSELGMIDSEILNSVAHHTLGNPQLTALDGIIYISDFLGSDYFYDHPSFDDSFSLAKKSLAYGMNLKAKNTMQDLISKNKSIHENTLQIYNKTNKLLEEV
ncbi:MAG: bis(5'-nucleosyl)-tetraphosphatase (symmetrical) YqeK [Leptospiraceae bacterium]|nr:bis(5'-nucleosyl)-tetraphosphatase (symmetrical) YqeK [Leptospiraceae bacterium]